MAQLVEQRIRNAWVPGSSPGIGSLCETPHHLFPLAVIAQLVEHKLPKLGVTGSNPAYRSHLFLLLMKRVFLLLAVMAATIFSSARTDLHTVSFNGVQMDKQVTSISYFENTVTLTWSDNTSISGDMAELMLRLAMDNDINKVRIYLVSGFYDKDILVKGLVPGTPIYIYDMKGREMARMDATEHGTKVDIHNLNTGVYFLKNNSTVVKFVKK